MTKTPDKKARGPGPEGRLSVSLGVLAAALLAAALTAPGQDKKPPPPPSDQVRVELNDAQTLQGKLEAVTGETLVLVTAQGKRDLPLSGISELTLSSAPMPSPLDQDGKLVVLTAGQEPVLVSRLAMAGGKVEMTNASLGRLVAPLAGVSMLLMPPPGRTPADVRRKLTEIKTADEAADLFLVGEQIEQAMPVEGVLKAMDEQFVTLDWKGQDQRIARKKVVGVVLAGTRRPDKVVGRVVSVDGSELAMTKIELAGGQFTIHSPLAGAVRVARPALARIRLVSDKIASLLDFAPAAARHHGLLDAGFPHRLNRSAGGKPLSLDGKAYATGLGLHSFCELTYDLGGAYSKLVFLAGIDDAVRPKGDAVLTVLADDKPLGEPVRLTGKDNARSLSLDIAGAKRITLRVEFGPDKLDVADHVDIVSARLIK